MFQLKTPICLVILLSILSTATFAQFNIKDLADISSVKTIDSDVTDFSDLMFLKEQWKDKNYILLGEQSHGDGPTFEGRNRLIKFLHQEMGFDIIAFESGLYDNYHASEAVRKNPNSDAYNNSILSIWSQTEEINDLIEYVKASLSSDKPMQIAGFDYFRSNLYKDYFWQEVKPRLKTTLTEKELQTLEEIILGTPDILFKQKELLSAFNKAGEKAQKNLNTLAESNPSIDNRMNAQTFKTWIKDVNYEVNEANGVKFAVQNPRDELMADNFMFLTKLYPGKKIVAIGASYHFSNQITQYQSTDFTNNYHNEMTAQKGYANADTVQFDDLLKGGIPMGQILKSQFGDQLYSVGFTSLQGTFGLVNSDTYSILQGPANSMENQLNKLGHQHAMVHLNKENDVYFYASAIGNNPILAKWHQIFDGFFYTRDNYPPHGITYEEIEINSSAGNDSNDKIYGQTIDQVSKQAIPFTNIALIGTANGVSSNAEGEFVISIPLQESDQLVVSSIGYKNDTISVKNIQDKGNFIIQLQPRDYLLNEVVISGKPLSPKDIIKLAREKRDENYYQSALNQEFYFTSSEYTNDSLTFNENASILVYSDKGYQSSKAPWTQFYGEILQFRNTTGNARTGNRFYGGVRDMQQMFVHDVIFEKSNVLNRTSSYSLNLDDIVEYDGQLVYKIGFEAKNPNAYNTGYGYPSPISATGVIYIGMNDHAIVKFDICIVRQTSEFRNKKKRKKYEYDFDVNTSHHLTQSYKKYRGKYYLQNSTIINYNISTRLDNNASGTFLEYNVLNSTAVNYDNPVVIKRPIDNLKISKKAMSNEAFWDSHAQLLPITESIKPKCIGQ